MGRGYVGEASKASKALELLDSSLDSCLTPAGAQTASAFPHGALIGCGAALLCVGQGGAFDEQPLPFIALAAAAEADHHCGQLASPVRTTGQPGIARGQKNQVIQTRAAQAHWAGVLHDQ